MTKLSITGQKCSRASSPSGSQPPAVATKRAMLRFRQIKSLRKLALISANVHNNFNLERHLADRKAIKERRAAALAEWRQIAA